MRSIYLLGKDTADEWRLYDTVGGSPKRFFQLAQRIAWGVTQPELIRVDLVATARKLVASHGSAFPAHLFAAWVWRARDPDRAERLLETARELATADHPLVDLLPSAAEWQLAPVDQSWIEIHPGRMWRVPHLFPLAGAPFHTSSIATVIKLSSGDVAILNPVAFVDAIANRIAELGPVRWVISQGKGHSQFVASARKRFRGSLAIGTEGHLRHPSASHLTLDGLLEHTRLPDELHPISIDGHLFDEVMIVDRPTRTLIAQDVVGFSGGERSFVGRLYALAFGLVEPLGFASYSLMLWQKLPALYESFAKLRAADLAHVIGAHGPAAPRAGDLEALHLTLEHARGVGNLAHKALVARYFAAQPSFLRDLLRYMKASKGKAGAQLRESTAVD